MSAGGTSANNLRVVPAIAPTDGTATKIPVAWWDWTQDWVDLIVTPAVGQPGIVTGAEAAPTTSSHGIDCSAASWVTCYVGDLDTVTSYTVLVYAYCEQADEWIVLTRDVDTQYTWSRGNAGLLKTVSTIGLDRIAFVISAATFTDVTRRYRKG